MTPATAVLDAHVHIHDCYDVDTFFDHAFRNLSRAQPGKTDGRPVYCLLMTECANDHYFAALRELAGGAPATRQDGAAAAKHPQLRRWKASLTAEDESIAVTSGSSRLFLIAGRQVACKEGLEVLLLGTTGSFRDGRSIHDVLAEGAALGVPRVIPWGAGKWFFGRGRLLSRLVQEERDPLFFLGDEGGRPAFWPYPRHFREAAAAGIRDLPGTDPLPFPHDIEKVGRVGIAIPMSFDESRPAKSLMTALRANVHFDRFASLEPPGRFVRNQLAMQMRKRH